MEYITDKPIFEKLEDRFQRYPFAQRIAETIIQRKNTDGIVIGIYGEWGEGKTSVMNFIETELKRHKNVICIQLNPWRYSNENSMLYNLFNKIASSLNKSLLNKKEKIGDKIAEYSSLIDIDTDIVGSPKTVIDTISKILNPNNLEKLKDRLGSIIKGESEKIVVFIDDIDRLDIDEINSLFRIVKLTADLPNTTYILSFDEVVVSTVIEKRYPSNNNNLGQKYLDKIIQVPLILPKAQPKVLADFCFEIVNNVLNSNEGLVSDSEKQRFVLSFTDQLQDCFNTPRLIIRYGNSLSFILPILKGEVNIIDLMLIEAIKIVHPKLYSFIKENPDYFTSRYLNILGEEDKVKKEFVKKEIDTLLVNYNKKKFENTLKLLKELFPVIESVYSTYASSYINDNILYDNKRISSTYYFNKYFSYSVIKGELSDIAFEEFVAKLGVLSEEQISDEIKRLITNSSAGSFIFKMRNNKNEINCKEAKKLIISLIEINSLFSENHTSFYDWNSPKIQLAIFISQLIKNLNANKIEISKNIMKTIDSIDFAFEILRWMTPDEDNKRQNIFTKDQFTEIWKVLHKRLLKIAGGKSVFDKFPKEAYRICKYWETYERDNYNDYIKKTINKDKYKIFSIIRTYLPKFWSEEDGDYTTNDDLNENSYKYMTSIIDKEYIMNAILNVYSQDNLSKYELKWLDRGTGTLDDIQIALQFQHWYIKENKEGE